MKMGNKDSRLDENLVEKIKRELRVHIDFKIESMKNPDYRNLLYFMISDTSDHNRFNQIENLLLGFLTEFDEHYKKRGEPYDLKSYFFDFYVPMSEACDKFYKLYSEASLPANRNKIKIVYIDDGLIEAVDKHEVSRDYGPGDCIHSLWLNSWRIKI